MKFESKNYTVIVVDESEYIGDSNKKEHSYTNEYNLAPDVQPSSSYVIKCAQSGASCIVHTGGGASVVSNRSAILRGSSLLILVGDQIVCLTLPTLEKSWSKTIDSATAFQVYLSPDGEGLLIHGEIDISKISFEGEVIWSTSGKDIFSEGFTVYDDYVEAVDFNGDRYSISIKDGTNTLKDESC
jgi:hypothetical protein